MLYHAYEIAHAAIAPTRHVAQWAYDFNKSEFNPFKENYLNRYSQAQLELFLNASRRYAKPEFGFDTIQIDGRDVKISQEISLSLPFCDLLHFKREIKRDDPPVLILAPLSGHFATLLRGTVKKAMEDHHVYISDWRDARDVPLSDGRFDLDDYVDYIIEFCAHIHKIHGVRPHILGVCQPGVPALVAASLMAKQKHPSRPASLTLMGSPIDVSINPKGPNDLANSRALSWFENNVILTVPFPNRGMMRRVYPGFLQLQGFMTMNLDRHVDAHMQHFKHMVQGDGESAAAHRKFYDEYMAVMDMTAEFYLQTIDRVFQRKLLAKGAYKYRDELVDPSSITDTALFTIEGQRDDITGVGQTEAAHGLTSGLAEKNRRHWVQPKAGHYGIFNGSRWRNEIYPQVKEFISEHKAS